MFIRWLAVVCVWLTLAAGVRCEETLPPAPKRHFNDYARVVNATDAQQLDQRLVRYEQATTNQFVVAIFQKLETQSSLEDYTRRVANAWKVGQAGKNNGVVLFVFIQDRKMRIQVGPGLTGALPDTFCKRVLDEKLTPAFRRGDYAQGLRAAVDAVIHATEPKAANPAPAETPAEPAKAETPDQQPLPTPPIHESRSVSSPSPIGSLIGGLLCYFPFVALAVMIVLIVTIAGKFGQGGPARTRATDSHHSFHHHSATSHDTSGGFSSGSSSDSGFSGGGGSSDGGGGSSGSW
jgi:uncharacterized protein